MYMRIYLVSVIAVSLLFLSACGRQEVQQTFIESVGVQVDLPIGRKVDIQTEKAEIYNANNKRTITLEVIPPAQQSIIPSTLSALSDAMVALGYEVVSTKEFEYGFGGVFKKPQAELSSFVYIATINDTLVRCANGEFFQERDLQDNIELCATMAPYTISAQ